MGQAFSFYQHDAAGTLRSMLAICSLLGQLMSLAFPVTAGRATSAQFAAALILTPALVVGAMLSHLTHGRVGGRALRAFVLIFAVSSGTLLLVRG